MPGRYNWRDPLPTPVPAVDLPPTIRSDMASGAIHQPTGAHLPFGKTQGERPPTSVSDVPGSAARATPVPMPLVMAAAYGVYTLYAMAEDTAPAPLEVFLHDPGEVQACVAVASVVLAATCDTSPHLAQLRTTAQRLLRTHPAIGQELVEVLAGLDAELQGKA